MTSRPTTPANDTIQQKNEPAPQQRHRERDTTYTHMCVSCFGQHRLPITTAKPQAHPPTAWPYERDLGSLTKGVADGHRRSLGPETSTGRAESAEKLLPPPSPPPPPPRKRACAKQHTRNCYESSRGRCIHLASASSAIAAALHFALPPNCLFN